MRRKIIFSMLLVMAIVLIPISYGLSKTARTYSFNFLWEDTIQFEAKPITDPKIELQANFVAISLEYDNYTSPLYRFFLYNDSGLIWKKKIVGKVYGHDIARDGRHILVFLCKKGPCVAQLYSNKGELLWQSKNHDFYRFSEDGKQIVTNVASELEYFKTFSVFDLNGRVLWRRNFNEDLLDGIAFNNGKYILVDDGKTYLFDSKDGLIWEKEFRHVGEYKVSEDGQLILAYPGRRVEGNDILFYVIDLKGNILFEGKEGMRLSDKDSLYRPSRFYKDKVFIEGNEDDYLIDTKGNTEGVGIWKDFLRIFGLKSEEREHIIISPNLRYLLYQPQGGNVIRYYRID